MIEMPRLMEKNRSRETNDEIEKVPNKSWKVASGWLNLLSMVRVANGSRKIQAAATERVGSWFLNHWCASFKPCQVIAAAAGEQRPTTGVKIWMSMGGQKR